MLELFTVGREAAVVVVVAAAVDIGELFINPATEAADDEDDSFLLLSVGVNTLLMWMLSLLTFLTTQELALRRFNSLLLIIICDCCSCSRRSRLCC